jgi:hypothetical protein
MRDHARGHRDHVLAKRCAAAIIAECTARRPDSLF